jgi:glycosyltransferase involved in cell wall biosynthesis
MGMKIAIISDTRRPTRPDGNHGLGKSAHTLATGLAAKGHDITLFAGLDSQFEDGQLICCQREEEYNLDDHNRFDAYLDTTHAHRLSQRHIQWPVLNRVCDLECAWQVLNPVVESQFMLSRQPHAIVVKKGIDIDAIPFVEKPDDYVCYMAQLIDWKGIDDAFDLYRRGVNIQFAGSNHYNLQEIPNYHGILTGNEKWKFLGQSRALIHPARGDASPRSPLEAAACGTPTICYHGCGAMEHVSSGISGFVVGDVDDMADKIEMLHMIDRQICREWVAECFPLKAYINNYERLLEAVAEGEIW